MYIIRIISLAFLYYYLYVSVFFSTTDQCAVPPVSYWKQDILISFNDNFEKYASTYTQNYVLKSDNVFAKTYLYSAKAYYYIDYMVNPLYKMEYYTNSTIVCNNQNDMDKIPSENLDFSKNMFVLYAGGGFIPIFFFILFHLT